MLELTKKAIDLGITDKNVSVNRMAKQLAILLLKIQLILSFSNHLMIRQRNCLEKIQRILSKDLKVRSRSLLKN